MKTLIRHLQTPVRLHCLDDGHQQFVTRRDALEQDARFELATLLNDVVDRKRTQQPALDMIFADVVRIFDTIGIAAARVADDIEVERLFDSPLVIVERALGQRPAVVVQRRVFPRFRQLFVRDTSRAVEPVDDPDVFPELMLCHRTIVISINCLLLIVCVDQADRQPHHQVFLLGGTACNHQRKRH